MRGSHQLLVFLSCFTLPLVKHTNKKIFQEGRYYFTHYERRPYRFTHKSESCSTHSFRRFITPKVTAFIRLPGVDTKAIFDTKLTAVLFEFCLLVARSLQCCHLPKRWIYCCWENDEKRAVNFVRIKWEAASRLLFGSLSGTAMLLTSAVLACCLVLGRMAPVVIHFWLILILTVRLISLELSFH